MSNMPKATILVAEDNAALARVSSFNLQRAGFTVEVASNGQEALDKADVTQFDLVVTDEQMPIMTGQELCRRLRDDDRYTLTPIIFLTGKRFELESEYLKTDLRVSVVMGKPFSPRALVETVLRVIA